MEYNKILVILKWNNENLKQNKKTLFRKFRLTAASIRVLPLIPGSFLFCYGCFGRKI